MKVFFTASTTHDGEYRPQYRRIVATIKKYRHVLTSGSQIAHDVLLTQDRKLPAEKIFRRELQSIEEADCVIAEVSSPSSGVGGEIVYALVHHKPVLALFFKDTDNQLSPMIAGNPSDHLFLEHYEDDNVGLIIKHFLDQVAVEKKRKGKLIVIDGGDGSGKATQSHLLITILEKKKYRVKYMDFPRYYSSFHGKIVGRFLTGEFGKLDDVSPYLSSLAYALDRASAKEEMDAWLSRGGIIVSNRYATSSMAHQGARLPKDQQKDFINWIDELEYKVHKIPREDLVIYLYVPWKIGYELTLKKEVRAYAKGGLDLAEKDMKHRQEAEALYLRLAKERGNWVMIDCVKDGTMRTKEEIFDEILKVLKSKQIIS